MKGIWKWISLAAGIFLLMACVGLIAAFGVGGRFMMMGRGFPLRMPFGSGPGRGLVPRFGFGLGPRMMMPGSWLMGLGIGLFILVLLALVGLGLYLALRKRPQVVPATSVAAATQVVAAVQVATPTQAGEPMNTAVPPAAATMPCAHCGQPVQAGWVACPFCGEKI